MHPQDPNSPEPVIEFIPCFTCGTDSETLQSRLNGYHYCHDCIDKIIAEEEKDYPGDKGNHKITDFK